MTSALMLASNAGGDDSDSIVWCIDDLAHGMILRVTIIRIEGRVARCSEPEAVEAAIGIACGCGIEGRERDLPGVQ